MGTAYTYRTDAIQCMQPYASEAEALAAALADREWPALDTRAEARAIADGGWLCIYDGDGVPALVRGKMP